MAEWNYLCRFEEIPDGRGLIVEAGGARLAVVRSGDSVAVLFDRCPHAGGSLDRDGSKTARSSAPCTAGGSACATAGA